VIVEGNGECIYYILSDKTAEMTGVNKIICSNITIRFKEGKVNNLSFYKQPDGRFIPPQEITEEDIRLKGFVWKQKEKPVKSDAKKVQPPPNAFPIPAKQLK
jgi:hypothetical protein